MIGEMCALRSRSLCLGWRFLVLLERLQARKGEHLFCRELSLA